MWKWISCLFFLIIPALTLAQSGYVCTADYATGFRFDASKKKWGPAPFSVESRRYLLTEDAQGWVWRQFGEKDEMRCRKDFNDVGYLRCDFAEVYTIEFNKNNLRYLFSQLAGYVNEGIRAGEGDGTPYIEIGKCSQL